MGYTTYYVIQADDIPEGFAEELNKVSNYHFEDWGGSLETEAKRFDWEENLKTLSLKYPETLFTVTGTGEDDDDRWKAYIQNGKMQFTLATITYDPYDPNLMS